MPITAFVLLAKFSANGQAAFVVIQCFLPLTLVAKEVAEFVVTCRQIALAFGLFGKFIARSGLAKFQAVIKMGARFGSSIPREEKSAQ